MKFSGFDWFTIWLAIIANAFFIWSNVEEIKEIKQTLEIRKTIPTQGGVEQ